MSITTHTDAETETKAETDEQHTNTADQEQDGTLDSDLRLAVECLTCGAILPIDAGREWIEPDIECPACRRSWSYEEVLLW